jgi:hypothetical protein
MNYQFIKKTHGKQETCFFALIFVSPHKTDPVTLPGLCIGISSTFETGTPMIGVKNTLTFGKYSLN